MRLMKDRDTGENKGYAFIVFKTKEVARKAIEKLRNKELEVLVVLCILSNVFLRILAHVYTF